MSDSPPNYICPCLGTVKDNLAKHHKTDVELQLSSFIDHSDEEAETCQFILGFPPLFYKWMEGKKVRKGHVQFQFCPLCGKKI